MPKEKPSMKQGLLFGSYKTMTLLDCFRECGRLRRVMYGKMVAEETMKSLAMIQPAVEEEPRD